MAHLKRAFETLRIERAPGNFVRTHTVKCGHPGCTNTEHIYFRAGQGTPPEAVYKKFIQRDWYVDLHDASKDRCRHHKAGRAALRIVQPRETPRHLADQVFAKLSPPNSNPPASAPPKEDTMSTPAIANTIANTLTTERRRVIFAKLNEVYLDEKRGYSPQWSDEAVAKDLGTQVEWVRTIRAENFGALNTNGEAAELIAKAKRFSDEAWDAIREIQKVSPIVQKALGLRAELEKIDNRIAELLGKK